MGKWYSSVCSDRIYAVVGGPDESGLYKTVPLPSRGDYGPRKANELPMHREAHVPLPSRGDYGPRPPWRLCAVLLAVSGRIVMLPFSNILFPTDFSERSVAAFHVACALARDHGAALTVLHVRETPPAVFAEFGALPPPENPSRTEVLEKLNEFEPPDEKVHVEYLIAEGSPAEEIVNAAADRNSDLIVMGTHGRTGLGRLVMGSVAEEVVRKAPCPVLTLKSPLPAAETLQLEPVVA